METKNTIFNRQRMEEALAGSHTTVPNGMTREEKRELMSGRKSRKLTSESDAEAFAKSANAVARNIIKEDKQQ